MAAKYGEGKKVKLKAIPEQGINDGQGATILSIMGALNANPLYDVLVPGKGTVRIQQSDIKD